MSFSISSLRFSLYLACCMILSWSRSNCYPRFELSSDLCLYAISYFIPYIRLFNIAFVVSPVSSLWLLQVLMASYSFLLSNFCSKVVRSFNLIVQMTIGFDFLADYTISSIICLVKSIFIWSFYSIYSAISCSVLKFLLNSESSVSFSWATLP